MADQTGANISTEEASSNFYWTCGEREVFNVQTTIRGNPTPAQVAAHIKAVTGAMGIVVQTGGHAKQVGQQPQTASQSQSQANGNSGYEWTQRKSKPFLLLHGQAAPEEIECPIHAGKTYKKKSGQYGPYYSHKDGDGWCNGNMET